MTDQGGEPEGKTLPVWYTPVTEDLLQEITRRIVEALHPEKITTCAVGRARHLIGQIFDK